MAGKAKYNKGIATFICEKVAEGYTISRLCKEFKDQLVAEKTVYQWKDKYPNFREQLSLAYQTHIYKQMDELRDLSEELLRLDRELANSAPDEFDVSREAMTAFKAKLMLARDRRDNIRVRIDAIKFSLSHLAPKLVPELKDQKTPAPAAPTIKIITYKDSEDLTQIEGSVIK